MQRIEESNTEGLGSWERGRGREGGGYCMGLYNWLFDNNIWADGSADRIGTLLLFRLLLQGYLIGTQTPARSWASDQGVLFIPSSHHHCSCCGRDVLPQQMARFCQLLQMDAVSIELRRVQNTICRGLGCIGPSAIYRISLSFLILFLLMMVVTACRNRLAMVINEGLFCVKYILVLAIFIAFLFVQNNMFDEYSTASKYISIFFMIIQVRVEIYSPSCWLICSIWPASKWQPGMSMGRPLVLCC